MNFLKTPCSNCPFRKDMGYLNGERIKEIADGIDRDELFPCHKTVDHDAYNLIQELDEIIEGFREDSPDDPELEKHISEFKERNNYDEAIKELRDSKEKEGVCGGWLILAKKENRLFNNRNIRIGKFYKMFDENSLKNEDLVFDSTLEAVKKHNGSN